VTSTGDPRRALYIFILVRSLSRLLHRKCSRRICQNASFFALLTNTARSTLSSQLAAHIAMTEDCWPLPNAHHLLHVRRRDLSWTTPARRAHTRWQRRPTRMRAPGPICSEADRCQRHERSPVGSSLREQQIRRHARASGGMRMHILLATSARAATLERVEIDRRRSRQCDVVHARSMAAGLSLSRRSIAVPMWRSRRGTCRGVCTRRKDGHSSFSLPTSPAPADKTPTLRPTTSKRLPNCKQGVPHGHVTSA